jgi:hypothetical protein
MDAYNNHLQSLAQRRADLRKPADYTFNWTAQEEANKDSFLKETLPRRFQCRNFNCLAECHPGQSHCFKCGGYLRETTDCPF